MPMPRPGCTEFRDIFVKRGTNQKGLQIFEFLFKTRHLRLGIFDALSEVSFVSEEFRPFRVRRHTGAARCFIIDWMHAIFILM
jgi:hypothetical protein